MARRLTTTTISLSGDCRFDPCVAQIMFIFANLSKFDVVEEDNKRGSGVGDMVKVVSHGNVLYMEKLKSELASKTHRTGPVL